MSGLPDDDDLFEWLSRGAPSHVVRADVRALVTKFPGFVATQRRGNTLRVKVLAHEGRNERREAFARCPDPSIDRWLPCLWAWRADDAPEDADGREALVQLFEAGKLCWVHDEKPYDKCGCVSWWHVPTPVQSVLGLPESQNPFERAPTPVTTEVWCGACPECRRNVIQPTRPEAACPECSHPWLAWRAGIDKEPKIAWKPRPADKVWKAPTDEDGDREAQSRDGARSSAPALVHPVSTVEPGTYMQAERAGESRPTSGSAPVAEDSGCKSRPASPPAPLNAEPAELRSDPSAGASPAARADGTGSAPTNASEGAGPIPPAVSTAPSLVPASPWRVSSKGDQEAREFFDGHYSRQTPGSPHWLRPGFNYVLRHDDEAGKIAALFVWWRPKWGSGLAGTERKDGLRVLECTVFRRMGGDLASDLIRAAETALDWPEAREALHLDAAGQIAGLLTGVSSTATADRRGKASLPGKCFREAGWTEVKKNTASRADVWLEKPWPTQRAEGPQEAVSPPGLSGAPLLAPTDRGRKLGHWCDRCLAHVEDDRHAHCSGYRAARFACWSEECDHPTNQGEAPPSTGAEEREHGTEDDRADSGGDGLRRDGEGPRGPERAGPQAGGDGDAPGDGAPVGEARGRAGGGPDRLTPATPGGELQAAPGVPTCDACHGRGWIPHIECGPHCDDEDCDVEERCPLGCDPPPPLPQATLPAHAPMAAGLLDGVRAERLRAEVPEVEVVNVGPTTVVCDEKMWARLTAPKKPGRHSWDKQAGKCVTCGLSWGKRAGVACTGTNGED